MGLLALGTAYEWEEAQKYADHVRHHGISQFLSIWHRLKDRKGDALLWGDEVEYVVVSLDADKREARLSLRQEVLKKLSEEEGRGRGRLTPQGLPGPTFHPEYGRYMLESTPGTPYDSSLSSLLLVEPSMLHRRLLARSHLPPNTLPLTLTAFPRLGAPRSEGEWLDPPYEAEGGVARSKWLPDEIINTHIRFPTLTKNIRLRRRSNVFVSLPLFHDTDTPSPASDHAIEMDAMGFGMGLCCLQITFQACSVEEARRVYDALVPIGPLMLALSAAAPIFKGRLSERDCRWDVIAGSVDDRTEEERGLKPLQTSRFRIPKSRYDSVSLYISNDPINFSLYNDLHPPIDLAIKNRLMEEGEGIDERLAEHVAHLFIRDPLVVFSESLEQDDNVESDHFENIQSTNWQSVRFKPPPSNSSIGWRVEFRSMEVQLTDFENAAYAVFVVLLTRAILSFGLSFYIPISKVDENMKRAQVRDACQTQKFFFRKNVFNRSSHHFRSHSPSTNGTFTPVSTSGPSSPSAPSSSGHTTPTPILTPQNIHEEYTEMTMDEVINGKSDVDFPGLMGLVRAYFASLNMDVETKEKLGRYLGLVSGRASGELQTTATWIRNFVRSHPSYKFDSVIGSDATYDLCKAVDEVERGVKPAEELLGKGYRRSGEVLKAWEPLGCQ